MVNCNNTIDSGIAIGQGETKSLIFKIKTAEFVGSDTLLFAMKNTGYDTSVVMEFSQKVEDITLEDEKYNFIVPFSSAETLALAIGEYLFDLTLIDENGEKKQLIKPRKLSITPTIGASISEV